MNSPRTIFKQVSVKGSRFLYPTPVIKESKYLLKVRQENAQDLIDKIASGLVDSPDITLSQLKKIGVHTDGNTPIYEYYSD